MQLRFQDFDTQIQRTDTQIKEQSRQMAVVSTVIATNTMKIQTICTYLA